MMEMTKENLREKHKGKIEEILSQGKGADVITDYLMSKIGAIISRERKIRKNMINRMNHEIFMARSKADGRKETYRRFKTNKYWT